VPSPLNVTTIPAPRTPLTDPATGLLSREWYRFFLNLFDLTGAGTNPTSLDELQIGPPFATVDEITNSTDIKIQGFATSPSQDGLLAQIAELQKQVQATELNAQSLFNFLLSQLTQLSKQVDGLESQPVADAGAVSAAFAGLNTIPVTKTADFTVGLGEVWIINNKSGSTCTVTLPTASSYSGRVLTFQNYQAQFLVSASSNVVPLGGGAAGTAILENVAGNWATLVSNGTNWVMMQEAPNNALLIE
jgi:hypothetical protein